MTLRVEDATVLLGRRPVLLDVHASFAPGQLVAIVGPNGAGKTSLLRALAGLLPLQQGRIQWDGTDVAALAPRNRARLVGFVPQESPFDYPFTVREVVAMGRYAHTTRWAGPTADDARLVAAAMDAMQVSALADRAVTALSGGERRRVALARALAQAPRLLLLDEPTANLDLGQAHRVHRLLRERTAAGTAVAMVMHDLETAARVADRLVLLARGRLVATGTARDVLSSGHVSEAFETPVEADWRDGELRLRVLDQ